MKTNKLWSIVLMLICAVGMSNVFTSCNQNTPVNQVDGGTGGNGGTSSVGSVADPAGTITLSMRNASNGQTELGSIFIDEDDNFNGTYWQDYDYGSYPMFASVGKVNGLGNVTGIPTQGWANKIAVVPGEGVVAFADGTFYRIYVKDYVLAAGTGGIIGADIKYQAPFGGKDEAIQFEQKSISFDSKGGNENVLCSNSTIIPFTVKSSEAWCRVKTCSSDKWFLVDGVHVECAENFGESSRTATITVTTKNKKETTFKVTQLGGGPIIKILEPAMNFDAFGGENMVHLITNQSFEDLQVTNVPSWIKAKLIDNSNSAQAAQKRVRWIGSQEAETTRASETTAKQYMLQITTEGNPFTTQRNAELIIQTKDGNLSEKIIVTQSAGWFNNLGIETSTVNNKSGQNSGQNDWSIYFETSMTPESLIVETSENWVKAEIGRSDYYYQRGHTIYVNFSWEANSTVQERSAKINIYASDGKTLIHTYTINQEAQTFDVPEKAYLDKQGGAKTITIKTSIPSWDATSSASWLTFSKNGNQITIRAEQYNGTAIDRFATISFTGLDRSFTVIQSKYAVGDTFNEGGATGTVGYMNDSIRLVYSANLGEAAWSTENVATGATSRDDGVYNTNVIKAIPGYQNLYPAFALVETLNVNGVTGWYLPASTEANFVNLRTWTSTEIASDRANCAGYGNCIKTSVFSVYGVRRF